MIYVMGSEIYQASLDGTESRKLVSFSSAAVFPRFSPDGSILRFTMINDETKARSIWEVRADGTGLHQIC